MGLKFALSSLPAVATGYGRIDCLQGTPARVDVARVRTLVRAIDRKIFIIPQVTMQIVVIRGVVPQRVIEQVIFNCLHTALQSPYLGAEIPSFIGFFPFQVKWDAKLSQDKWHTTQLALCITFEDWQAGGGYDLRMAG